MQDRLKTSPKQHVVAAARRAGALPVLEGAKFLAAAARAAPENAAFLRQNPDFAPPPLWWMHDMYSHASYAEYMRSGRETAATIAEIIARRAPRAHPRVGDWGCGLARVIRHLPETYERTGFDYNAAAIHWCKEHIEGVAFFTNALSPPLPAEEGAFDALYALSVFTHLSPEGHEVWIREIARVLAPGGVFLGAFHMAPPAGQLFGDERARFEAGELVVRGRVKEGGRTYTAFHPETYLRERLLAAFDILEGPLPFFGQALLVARKRN